MQQPESPANDIILYSLLARIALKNNETIEFRTKLDQSTNTIELCVDQKYLYLFDQIQGMQRGPRFKAFINWLIGSETLVTADVGSDRTFIASSLLDVWFGAKPTNIEGNRLVLILPTTDASVVGFNTKTVDGFVGTLRVSLIWMFIDGDNTSFKIKTKATISNVDGGTPFTVANETDISTFNLINEDIRETILLEQQIDDSDSIINLLLHRNYVGAGDDQTETVGVVGLKIEFV